MGRDVARKQLATWMLNSVDCMDYDNDGYEDFEVFLQTSVSGCRYRRKLRIAKRCRINKGAVS